MASVVGLEVLDKSSTHISGNSAEFFDNAPTHFSTHNGYRGKFGGRRLEFDSP